MSVVEIETWAVQMRSPFPGTGWVDMFLFSTVESARVSIEEEEKRWHGSAKLRILHRKIAERVVE